MGGGSQSVMMRREVKAVEWKHSDREEGRGEEGV